MDTPPEHSDPEPQDIVSTAEQVLARADSLLRRSRRVLKRRLSDSADAASDAASHSPDDAASHSPDDAEWETSDADGEEEEQQAQQETPNPPPPPPPGFVEMCWAIVGFGRRSECVAFLSLLLILLSTVAQITRMLLNREHVRLRPIEVGKKGTAQDHADMEQYDPAPLPAFFVSPKAPLRKQSAGRPVPFFGPGSGLTDLYRGNGGDPRTLVAAAEITLVFYYAPWSGSSRSVRNHIQNLAHGYRPDQVRFVAINCWTAGGACRSAYKLYTYPVLAVYPASPHAIFYSGPLAADYLYHFLEGAVSPLVHLNSESDIIDFLLRHEYVAVAVFRWGKDGADPPGFRSFHWAALRALERDPLRRLRFLVLTNSTLADELMDIQAEKELHLFRHRGGEETHVRLRLEGQPWKSREILKALFGKMDEISSWAGPVVQWLPYAELEGGKSDQLQRFLIETDGPTIILLTPRRVLFEDVGDDANVAAFKLAALEYASCRAAADDESRILSNARDMVHTQALSRRSQLREWTESCRELSQRQKQLKECCQDVVLTVVPGAAKRNICEVCGEADGGQTASGLRRFLLRSGGEQSLSIYDEAGKSPPRAPASRLELAAVRGRACEELEPFVSATGLVDYCCRREPRPTAVPDDANGKCEKVGCPSRPLPMPSSCRRLRLAKHLGYPGEKDQEPELDVLLSLEEDKAGFQMSTCYNNETLRFAALDSAQMAWLGKKFFGDLKLRTGVENAAFAEQPRVFIINNATEAFYAYPPLDAPPNNYISTSEIRDFIANHSRDQLERHRRVAEIPELASPARQSEEEQLYWEPKGSTIHLLQLNADNYEEVTSQDDKDVLVFYSGGAWCGACAGVFHIVLTAAAYFRGLSDRLVFAQLDASANDLPWALTVERVPGLLLFRGGDSAAFPAALPLTLPNLLAFLLAHARPQVRWRHALSVCVGPCLQRNARSSLLSLELLRSDSRRTRRNLRRLPSPSSAVSRATALGFRRHLAVVEARRRLLRAFLRLLGSLRLAGADVLRGRGKEALLLEWLIRGRWREEPILQSLLE